MGQPAAKQGDKIVATDTHILLIPSPAGPVPTPTPLPFVGTIMTGLSTDVFIEGKPAATVDSVALNQPIHVPAGGPFQKPPTNQGKILVGSTGVFINGKPAARQGDMATTCNDPVDMPIGQVVAVGTVFIGETGAGAPKPPPQPPTMPRLVKAKVGQPGQIVKARWEKNRAKCGEKIKLIVDVKDFEDGTPARFVIWKEEAEGHSEFITEIGSEIQGNRAEAVWAYSGKELKEELKQEMEGEEGEPNFFFAVDIERSEARSQTLKFTCLLEIDLKDEKGEALDDVKYTITFSDRTKKKGKFKNGRAEIEDAPLGKYTLDVEGYDFVFKKE
jgi:uncharacterized Zn-binding protein involved in type VI secretion